MTKFQSRCAWRAACLATALFAFGQSAVRAANVYYGTNAGAQSFTTASWVDSLNAPVATPGSGDLPFINSVDGVTNYAYIDSSVSVQRFLLADKTTDSGGFEIRSGGALTTSATGAHYVGARGTAYLRLQGGGTLNINGSLQVGWGDGTGRGTGTVTQTGGTYNGTSASAGITIGNLAASGQLPASVGTYNMSGGSMLLGAALVVGNAGVGTFNMNGGVVNVGSYIQVGRTGTGSVIQTAGDVAAIRGAGDAMVIAPFAGAKGDYSISGGSLSITSLDGSGGVTVGVASGDSTARFNVTGNAPVINFNNSFLQHPNAILEYDIGTGISPINVMTTATLNGVLDVKFTTTPMLGQQFTIMNYGSLANPFAAFDAQVDSPLGANSVHLSIDYGTGASSSIVLTVDSVAPAGLAGDFDNDGDVDGADFIVWQTHYPTASGAILGTGDANGDGDVDGGDFAAWQGNFPHAPGGVVAVPEPASAMLLSIGAIAFCTWQRKHNARLLNAIL